MCQEKELSINVNTLAQTEQALKKLDSLESNAQVSVSPIPMPRSDPLFLVSLQQPDNKMSISFKCQFFF